MIVVVGQPILRDTATGAELDGLPARIAVTAAERSRSVQLVGTAGEDEAGDAVVLALARAGVGHVALLRKAGQQTVYLPSVEPDPVEWAGSSLDAADVDLALRYLPDISVLVLAGEAAPETVAVVAQAAGWSDSRLIIAAAAGARPFDGLPDDAIVFDAPSADPDGAFASMVGEFAAALDSGKDPAEAFRASINVDGWAPTSPD